eukprot:1394641-Amorphochlora_amoeboformis.AAC.1
MKTRSDKLLEIIQHVDDIRKELDILEANMLATQEDKTKTSNLDPQGAREATLNSDLQSPGRKRVLEWKERDRHRDVEYRKRQKEEMEFNERENEMRERERTEQDN